jgi:diguanylate cyclase (GGDEF)-like protein
VPTVFTWRQLAGGGNLSQGHGFDLVTIEGEVVAQVREATQDGYVLSAEGHLVSAIFSHPDGIWGLSSLAPMKQLPIGAKVQVTGICILSNPDPFTDSGEVAFDIYLRSPDDISVVANPPWLNVRHLVYLAGLLMIALLAIGARALYLEHRSRRQTAGLAQIEKRRSTILEDINVSRPLAEILDKITALAAFNLGGAPCWCHLNDGTEIGNRPGDAHRPAPQTVEHPIHARNGVALGKLCAAVAGRGLSESRAREALAMAAELATLAVETSRLYSDLVHRSEFDLLTDIHNRFSLEASLDGQIVDADHSGAVFGLIYIDLNDFKQVNDSYGHHAGDIYLQQVAARMKSQIRPGDMLARLGGDEFAVLVREARSRSDIRDIAMRLEGCFDEPFDLPTGPIKGSASIGIALYREDGVTRDSILSAADAAMYAAKHEHRKLMQMLTPHEESTQETIR